MTTDELRNGTPEEDAVAEEEEPEVASESFLVVLGREKKRLLLTKGGEAWIEAQAATARGEDRVTEAQANAIIAGGGGGLNRAQRRATKTPKNAETNMRLSLKPNEAFMRKCVEQVTGYCLPMRYAGQDKVVTRRYNERGGGDNEENMEMYEGLATGNVELRTLVENFLDFVAGRGGDAQADFEDFLAAHPQRVQDI